MPVDAADVAELQRLATTFQANDDLAPITSIPELIAYIATQARAQGEDEADWAELLIRAAEMQASDVRAAEIVLRPLGYHQVCTRLREIAGRRKHDLRPIA
jgi:hypothetical protein